VNIALDPIRFNSRSSSRRISENVQNSATAKTERTFVEFSCFQP